ncbi:MAG: hypothetical protein C4563_06975 [Desulfobulbus sp.]|nr:MAG: hypothetical protein C4563_06975 [Desulfobulbus sp.]
MIVIANVHPDFQPCAYPAEINGFAGKKHGASRTFAVRRPAGKRRDRGNRLHKKIARHAVVF